MRVDENYIDSKKKKSYIDSGSSKSALLIPTSRGAAGPAGPPWPLLSRPRPARPRTREDAALALSQPEILGTPPRPSALSI